MKIAAMVETRSPQQCMSKWYSGYGDKVMGTQFDDNDDLALVCGVWDQDPNEPAGAWLAAGCRHPACCLLPAVFALSTTAALCRRVCLCTLRVVFVCDGSDEALSLSLSL